MPITLKTVTWPIYKLNKNTQVPSGDVDYSKVVLPREGALELEGFKLKVNKDTTMEEIIKKLPKSEKGNEELIISRKIKVIT